MRISVRRDDLSSPEVQSLVAEHLSGMHSNTPPGHVHALAIENLRAPNVTFWCAWADDVLCGCGALKELDRLTGEVKSMRTRSAFLRRGVGQAILDEIIRTSRQRGYARLLLETGTGQAFDAAHVLYQRNGFAWDGRDVREGHAIANVTLPLHGPGCSAGDGDGESHRPALIHRRGKRLLRDAHRPQGISGGRNAAVQCQLHRAEENAFTRGGEVFASGVERNRIRAVRALATASGKEHAVASQSV